MSEKPIVVRDEVLPNGVYWVDLFGADTIALWGEWATIHKGLVVVLKTVEEGGTTTNGMSWTDAVAAATPLGALLAAKDLVDAGPEPHAWVLFEVKAPVPRWPANIGAGLPTVASEGRDTEKSDTVQRPPPEELGIGDWFSSISPFESATNAFAWTGALALGGLILWGVSKR